ncbi:hypothetical protein K3181_04250 [Qipengyuania sp. YG27]|uniref:CD-NTase-associated protein 15 domain-containing protein n=1 Tax=Qipengyuania mesophila TaxID=2867246 RepID=A0ABS7JST4_9SPHN|nr:hypothetical protein [Qipengyuania mesophila]MBX7500646.1 hypothetical protein [Qipengyuania mesophila]
MMTRPQITAFLTLSVTFWVGLLALKGTPLSWEMLAPFGTVVGAVSGVMLLFDAWAWKLPIFRGWLIKRPYVHGTWKVELQSDWVNPETNEGVPTIHCFLVVRQTASQISLRLITEESSSETVSAGVEACSDGTFEISCAYRNKPKSMYRYRSQIHYGAMLLSVESATPTRLEGEYWTDRKTTGSVTLTDRKSKTPMTFNEAQALYQS